MQNILNVNLKLSGIVLVSINDLLSNFFLPVLAEIYVLQRTQVSKF